MTNKDIQKAYIGDTQVSKIYLGDALVYGGENPGPGGEEPGEEEPE